MDVGIGVVIASASALAAVVINIFVVYIVVDIGIGVLVIVVVCNFVINIVARSLTGLVVRFVFGVAAAIIVVANSHSLSAYAFFVSLFVVCVLHNGTTLIIIVSAVAFESIVIVIILRLFIGVFRMRDVAPTVVIIVVVTNL